MRTYLFYSFHYNCTLAYTCAEAFGRTTTQSYAQHAWIYMTVSTMNATLRQMLLNFQPFRASLLNYVKTSLAYTALTIKF